MNGLKIIGFERYDDDELNPVNRFRIESEPALTVWDVSIIQREEDEWFLTMIDFTHCLVEPSNGTIWSSQADALAEALDVATRAGRLVTVAA